jgi:DMSO/TMAO reductase YedYZ heme-binding membrane subunit
LLLLHFATVIGAAVGSPGAGSTSSSYSPWDVLYITAGLVLFVLLVVAVAASLNGRERRRDEKARQ